MPRYARCGESEESRGEEESSPPFLWGLEIPKRTRPEGPLRSRPEGQKSVGSARSIIRKRQRADGMSDAANMLELDKLEQLIVELNK